MSEQAGRVEGGETGAPKALAAIVTAALRSILLVGPSAEQKGFTFIADDDTDTDTHTDTDTDTSIDTVNSPCSIHSCAIAAPAAPRA